MSERLEEIIADIIESTRQTALKDGKITPEENSLLQLLISEINKIGTEVKEIIPSLDLTDEELTFRLKQIFENILLILNKVALEDGIITDDESSILSQIITKFNTLQY